MHTSILVSKDIHSESTDIRAFILSSHHRRKQYIPSDRDFSSPRSQSEFGTKSYRDALQRAFNKAKLQIFFNPDMQYFVTLTYKGLEHTIDDVMYDMKIWLKHERRKNPDIKYIWVAEYQKRGSIHVHMITNANFTMRKNKNGYDEITYWSDKIGFTSVLHISNFDNNFKPYLYLFKYMRKAQRIGKSFIHSSRNLSNYEEHHQGDFNFNHWNTLTQEYSFHTFPNNPVKKAHFYRYYLQYSNPHDRIKHIKQEKDYYTWHKVLLHSTKEKEKIAVNHLQH